MPGIIPGIGEGGGEQGEMAAVPAVRESSDVFRSAGQSRWWGSARANPQGRQGQTHTGTDTAAGPGGAGTAVKCRAGKAPTERLVGLGV